ncbi:hypothetical protein WIW50_02355 [Flavobacteriaceae bacterium 3-367]
MENSTAKLLLSIENIETEEIRGMKDSLADFFKDWVNASHDTGHLRRDIHEAHTEHFSSIKDLLNEVLKYKVQNGHR